MNAIYRVWNGEQMYYSFDDELTMIIEPSGAWEVKRNGIKGETVAHSHDGKSVLMWGTDQVENQVITVYEGDVIEQEETELGSPYEGVLIGSVNMLEGQWCIVNEKKKEARPVFSETAKNKILGDVFQNPELLGGAE
ncbi:YopX family protein [Bacillus inaquosorum]|uniref:YopX family protein n=1 Tax=Bacillus inaquosorum TaxID=483913 RepID=UPI0040568BBF